MIEIILRTIILILLIYGAYTDIKSRTVSNYVTFSIMILALPLAYVNEITLWHIVIGIIIAYMVLLKNEIIGPADAKTLYPLLCMSSLIEFALLWMVYVIIVYLLTFKYGDKVPAFVGIVMGYISMSLIGVL